MPGQITWEEVLKRSDLIGGDIETVEDDIPYRGPIGKIEQDGDIVRFISPWCARLNSQTGEWEKWDITSCFVTKEVVPSDIGNGRIAFQMPFLGHCTLFPKNGSKLSAVKVKGLPKASERLLALYPNLVFDRDAARKVCIDKTWPAQAEAPYKMADNSSIREFLAKFTHDSSAEEFLWFYIEAVTGDKNVHEKVY